MRRLSRQPIRWLVGTFLAGLLVVLFAPPAIGGGTSYVVVTGSSMLPNFADGDLVVVRRGEYRVGDVVAFETGSGLVIHRIVGGSADEGFVTQGDNKPSPDLWTPTPGEIVGEEFLHVPGGGMWVRELTGNRALLGVFVGGLGSLMIWSPRRRRGRRGAHLATGARRRRAPASVAPVTAATTPLLVLGGVALLLTVATIYLFLRPDQRMEAVEETLFQHELIYSYTASVSPSIVYEETTITPDPTEAETSAFYTQLLDELLIDFRYELVPAGEAVVQGEVSAELRIAAGQNLWTRRLELLPSQAFEGTTVGGSFRVDPDEVLGLVVAAEEQTGFAPSSYQLTVVTRVETRGEAGSTFDDVLVAELPMTLSETVVSIDNQLTTQETHTSSQEMLVANDLPLLGQEIPLPVVRVASGSALAVVVALGIVYVAMVHRRLGPPEVAKIRLRYGTLIVPVTEAPPNGARTITVGSIGDLARLAKRSEQLIFHETRSAGEHAFFVPDGPVVYQYRLETRTPARS